VELLVTLAVAGIVVLGLHEAVRVTVDAATATDDPARSVLRREAARATLRQWLEAASGFDGAPDGLSFVTRDPDSVRLRIGVIAGRGLVAWDSAAGRVLPLVPEARGLKVRYLVSAFGAAQWFDVWSAPGRLPRAVELTLDDPGAEPDLPLLVVVPGPP
jgi:hypothetical protein